MPTTTNPTDDPWSFGSDGIDDPFDLDLTVVEPTPRATEAPPEPLPPVMAWQAPDSQVDGLLEIARQVLGDRRQLVVAVTPPGTPPRLVTDGLARVLELRRVPLDLVRPHEPGSRQPGWLWDALCEPQQLLVLDDVAEQLDGGGYGSRRRSAAQWDDLATYRAAGAVMPLLVVPEAQLPGVLDEPAGQGATVVRCAPLAPDELRQVQLRALTRVLRHFHPVQAPWPVRQEVVERTLGAGDPQAAQRRLLTAAVGAAALDGRHSVQLDDLPPDSSRMAPLDHTRVLDSLLARVRGQDAAVCAVVDQLAVGWSGLQRRRHKPRAVLMFVGPSGVGKTELAKGIAAEVFGDEEAMVRLDMSEFEHPSSITRLIGPAPGYKGSTEPEGWFTTKVLARPRSVVLLDEVEKADPLVPHTFLQVFDEGRLTDGMGRVADFSETVCILTSNLGARGAHADPVGFGGTDEARRNEEGARRIREAVARHMPPELLGRIDATLVFDPLGPDAVRQIVAGTVDGLLAGLAQQGWTVTLGDRVLDWLAGRSVSREYGVRKLQKVVEQELLLPVLRLPRGDVRVTVGDGALVVGVA